MRRRGYPRNAGILVVLVVLVDMNKSICFTSCPEFLMLNILQSQNNACWCPGHFSYHKGIFVISGADICTDHLWQNLAHIPHIVLLTRWGRPQMAAISQTIYSNAFYWMKNFEFQIIFHCNVFLLGIIHNVSSLLHVMAWYPMTV